MTKEFSNEFGELIYSSRLKNELKQKDLAFLIGRSCTIVSNIENFGFIPSSDIVIKLAKILNLDVRNVIDLVIKIKTDKERERLDFYYNKFSNCKRPEIIMKGNYR